MVRIAMMTLVTSFLLVPGVLAADPVDVVSCRSGTATVLHGSEALTLLSIEAKGVQRGQEGNAAWDVASDRCIGVVRTGDGSSSSNGFCKAQDADGDLWLVEWRATAPEGGRWSYLGGTGKWQGISGGGEWRYILRTEPIAPGTFQNCVHITGSYELAG